MGAEKIEVVSMDPAGELANGLLTSVIPEQAHYPHIVIEMSDGVSPRWRVTLDQTDLSTIIVRNLSQSSTKVRHRASSQ